MAIKGSLKEASLPDVIQLLFLGRRTGCLALADRHNFGTIYFDEGHIVYAAIVNRRDRLGDIMVASGRITPEQLAAAIEQQRGERDHKLGEILVEQGAIERRELEQYIRHQIEEAVYYLFTWSSGTFNFEAGVRPEREDLLVRINPEFLLLEGARRVDEWSLIEKKIPTFDIIFSVDRAHLGESAPELSGEQRRLLPLLDGTRDVQQVFDRSGLTEFEAGKALFGLITAGFARRVGTSEATAPRVNDSRVEEHRNLGVAFYKASMFDEALREFRRVADLRPGDSGAPFFLGLIALRQARWEEAADAFRQAIDAGGQQAAALHNLGLALERLGRLDEAEAAAGDAAGRRPPLVSLPGYADADDADAGFERLSPDAVVLGGAAPQPGPEAAAESAAVRVAIDTALARMTELERGVILLAYRDGLTQSEISERLGWPLGTVKTRTRRALAHLRAALEGDDGPIGSGSPSRGMDGHGTR